LQNEDLQDLQKKRELQLSIQNDIEIINQQNQLQKEKRMEEEKLQDMQVNHFTKKVTKNKELFV